MRFLKKICLVFQTTRTKRKKEKILKMLGKRVDADLPLHSEGALHFHRLKYNVQLSNNEYVEAIIVKKSGRFGNEMIQIINTLYFAKKAGLKLIYFTWQPTFIEKNSYILDGITLKFGAEETEGKCCIIGKFFPIKWLCREGIPNDIYLKNSKSIYDNLLDPNWKKITFVQEDNDLVIHIRSGDIFKMNGVVNPRYAQPPLAFYIKVIELAQPGRAILAYEDRLNPCIEALEKYLSNQKIPYIDFCKSLPETVSLLLHAKNICYGFGTFVPQIVFLSEEKKQTGYSYNHHNSIIHQKFEKIFKIEEKNYEYKETVLAKWENTAEQREKMVTYRVGDFEITVSE